MTIQIVRLKDGSDVICSMQKFSDMVELDYPMMFSLVNQNDLYFGGYFANASIKFFPQR